MEERERSVKLRVRSRVSSEGSGEGDAGSGGHALLHLIEKDLSLQIANGVDFLLDVAVPCLLLGSCTDGRGKGERERRLDRKNVCNSESRG